MIYLIHGDNHLASRQKLVEMLNKAKLKKNEVLRFEGEKIELEKLIPAIESPSLFGEGRIIIIENFFSHLWSLEKEKIFNYLKKSPPTEQLIFWEKKEVPITLLKKMPSDWQILLFKIPAYIFQFLNSLKPNNPKMFYFLHRCLVKENTEFIFYMLAKHLRLLILAKGGEENLSGRSWYINKLINQASFFSLKKLIFLYRRLLKIEIEIKTGRSLMPLDWHLDLFVANI